MSCCAAAAHPEHSFDCDTQRKRDDERVQEAAMVVLAARDALEQQLWHALADLASPDRRFSPATAAEDITRAVERLVVAMLTNPEAIQ